MLGRVPSPLPSAVPYAVWGWGDAAQQPTRAELEALRPLVETSLGFALTAPSWGALPDPAAPRVELPASLASLGSADPVDRARHAIGRSYLDLIRGLSGDVGPLPDLVVRPTGDEELASVLDWADDRKVAVLPFGGGTSVVGGVGPVPAGHERTLISLD